MIVEITAPTVEESEWLSGRDILHTCAHALQVMLRDDHITIDNLYFKGLMREGVTQASDGSFVPLR